MRILICPTAFKESFSATEIVAALARGARRARPEAEIVRLPLSDGGPGLLESLRVGAPDAESRECRVRDPLGREVAGRVLRLGPREMVVESADACGLHLLAPEERDPLATDTRGVGDLIRAAFSSAPDCIYVGLGGSATCDGGAGMAGVLGWRFLDGSGRDLPPGGAHLRRLARVERTVGEGSRGTAAGEESRGSAAEPLTPPVRIRGLADVSNPLLGPRGAARVFAPQKGADAEGVERLEEGLRRLVERGPENADRFARMPGAGAAGGLGFGLAAFAGGDLIPGTEWLLERVGFHELLAGADLVITGEGAFDHTSDMGKVTGRVIRLAREAGVAVALVCGRIRGSPPEGVAAYHGTEGGGLLDREQAARLAHRAVGEVG